MLFKYKLEGVKWLDLSFKNVYFSYRIDGSKSEEFLENN